MNRTLRRAGWMIIVTIVLVAATPLGISLHAAGNAVLSRQEREQYFKEREKAYVKELRAYLTECGYSDSGVTLTRTTESDGTIYYNATIHHRRIDRMDASAREVLLAELAEIPSPVSEAEIFHDFLILNP